MNHNNVNWITSNITEYVHTQVMKTSAIVTQSRFAIVATSLVITTLLLSPVHACEITRALFTNDVVDREPVDQVLVLDRDIGKISFFAAASGCKGAVLVHRWQYEGGLVNEVRFDVASPRLRSFSTQEIASDKIGKWSVLVTDGEGTPLRAAIFYHGTLPPQAASGSPTYAVLPITQE